MIRLQPIDDALLHRRRTGRDRVAMALMLLCALGALYAFAVSVGDVLSAGPSTQQVEIWRTFGFAFFSAVFVLLALWPRWYPGLWEVAIANKAALTVMEVALIANGVANAQSSAIADGALTVVLIAGYVLARGWTSWSVRRMP